MMAAISASEVKELRDRTGLGMMDCKNALVSAAGDMELAIEILRKSSGMKAAKKAGRIARDGLLGCRVDGRLGVMVEVNCETDFAARNEHFLTFVKQVVEAVFDNPETGVENLLETQRESLVQKIGENIAIRRIERETARTDRTTVVDYLHTNGKIGVLLSLEGGDETLGKDIAMHVAAMNPACVQPDDVPASLLEKEREIYTAQAEDSGKPPEIAGKMVEGRLRKFLAEISLTEQPFVKDGNVKIGTLLKQAGATVNRFVRFEVGEGIEKEDVDFAAEVKQQLGQ